MSDSRKNFIESARLMLSDRVGIDLTFEKLSEIIGNQMDDEFTEFPYTSVSPSMDTSPREQVMELVSMYYMGRYWPCYADNVDMNDFMDQLERKIQEDAQ
jgi:hypothetical protein